MKIKYRNRQWKYSGDDDCIYRDRSNYDVISPLRIAPVQLHFT